MSFKISPLIGVAAVASMETLMTRLLWKRASEPSSELGKFPEIFRMIKTNDGTIAGTNFTLSSHHIVFTNSEFEKLDLHAKRFILLHECGHMRQLNLRIATLAVCALSLSMFPLLTALQIYLIATCFLGALAERRADAFAIQHATDQELRAGISYHSERQTEKLKEWEQAETTFAKCKVAWEYFLCYILTGHPLETTRISTIQNELQMRKFTAQAFV